MTNLPKLHQALHDASDEEIVGALHYLGKAARIAAAPTTSEWGWAVSERYALRWDGNPSLFSGWIQLDGKDWAYVGIAEHAERIAAALNAQAGVVEALRLCLRAMEVAGLEEVEGFSGEFKLARAAIKAVKEKGRG